MKRLGAHEQFTAFVALFESENSLYVVMEYVSGEPIFDLLEIEKVKEIKRVRIISQVVKALSVMEELGVVHRDLKPDNILITDKGTVKIIDYGLSLLVDCPKRKISRAGSPGFLDPELLKQTEVSTDMYCAKTDIYSLGIILYCMITGDHPFMADTSDKVLKKNSKGIIDTQLDGFVFATGLE